MKQDPPRTLRDSRRDETFHFIMHDFRFPPAIIVACCIMSRCSETAPSGRIRRSIGRLSSRVVRIIIGAMYFVA